MASGTTIDKRLCLTGVVETNVELGRGSYGRVFEVTYRGTVCAAKEIHEIIKADKTKESFLSECLCASKARHPNIVQFLGLYTPPNCDLPVMVMEKMEQNLTSLIEGHRDQDRDIPLHIKMSILHDVTLGLRYLHSDSPPTVHRDLSSNNIFLTAHLVAKIGDLGMAKVIDINSPKLTVNPGTTDFMSPESQCDNPDYGTPLDVFSFACVVVHLVTQEWPSPTSHVTRDETVRKEVERRQKYLDKMMCEETQELTGLVVRCLGNDPTKRPNIKEVSTTILNIKEKCANCSPYAGLNPITWQQKIEKVLDHTPSVAVDQAKINKGMDDQGKVEKPNDKVIGRFERIFSKDTPPIIPALCGGSYEISWTRGTDLPLPLYCTTAVAVGYKLYIVGATSAKEEAKSLVFVYDVKDNSWSKLPRPDHYFAIGENVEETLVIFGGRCCQSFQHSNQVSAYSEEQCSWIAKYPNMLKPRSRPCVVAYGQHVIVMGGMTAGDIVLNDIEVLSTRELKWREVATKLPCPMWNISTTCSDCNLFILGYADKHRARCCKMYVVAMHDLLSAAAVTWDDPVELPVFRSSAISNCCTPIIIGGNNNYSAVGDIMMYDVTKKSKWRLVGSLPTQRAYPIVGVVEGKAIVVAGGCSQARNKTECEASCLQTVEIGTSIKLDS